MDLKDKKVLITGGTSGIGRSLVAELIARGTNKIAVIARGTEKMDALSEAHPDTEFLQLQGDIADVTDIKKATERLKKEWGSLDLLINNAGAVSAGLLEDISDSDIIQQVEVNLTGPILLTKYCLPLLKQGHEPAIMNISSGLGLIGKPFYSTYASAKAGIRQFSDAMRRELRPDGIHVICIYPTATDTQMMESADTGDMDSPDMVAKKSIAGLVKGEINVIFGGQQRLDDNRLNFESPREMDKKVAKAYDKLKKRSAEHRAM